MFYQAIMRAADHIEQNPYLFNFNVMSIPTHCGSPGCALGWIGHFNNLRSDSVSDVSVAMGTDDLEFYRRVSALAPGWLDNSSQCVKGLRLYAEIYHRHEKTLTLKEAA